MKKIYSIFMFLLAGVALNAQSVQVPFTQANKTLPGRPIAPGALTYKMSPHGRSTESHWINYGVCIDSSGLNGGPGVSELNQNYLCTDSALLGNFGGTYAGVWVNNIGDILDVRAANVQSYYGTNWNANNTYSVDSMSVMYAYTRALASNIVDTLIVSLYYNTTSAIMPTYYFTGMQTNFGSDTLYFKAMPYTYTSNSPSAANKVTYKIQLTNADTAVTFFRMKDFATNYNVPGGKLVASSVTFKPGYAYSLGDTIDNKDAFYFASYEEGGNGGNGGSFPLYAGNCGNGACDWNASDIVTSDVRYNNAGGWNGFFIPSYAYTIGYAYEHHLIWYKVTSTNVGIAENNSTDFQLEQNVPNPTNGNTLISYSINKSSNVALHIFDVTGKQVMAYNKGQLSAGEYQIELNTSTLAPGVYFYTLTVDGQQATRRLVVTE
jgi:hypothetical protein